MAVTVIDTIKPKNDGDFPVLEDVDLQGGFRTVADATERDAIPPERRKEGMLVYQLDEEKYYKLTAVGDWEEAKMGADAGGMPRVHTEIIPDDDYDVSGVADWGIMVTGEGTLYYRTVGDPAVTIEYPIDGHTLIPGQFTRIMAATDGGLIVVGLAR